MAHPSGTRQGTSVEVLLTFLRLGLTSFGGPVAHLGYFRTEFVERRAWIGDRAYADLVALCQMLPGPASSQVGMAIGLQRAGYAGLLAAWIGFTLPSAVLMAAFGWGVTVLEPGATGWIQGLKAAVVAVVAQAVLGMARSLAPDKERAAIATAAMAVALLVAGPMGQVLSILAGGVIGFLWLRIDASDEGKGDGDAASVSVGRLTGGLFLAGFLLLLLLLPVIASVSGSPFLAMVDSFYRAGSLVFGGGHVVLPLLQNEVVGPGLVDRDAFLAGYGAAQAVPGPLFTFAAYLGAVSNQAPTGPGGAVIALLAVFLPSALLVMGCMPFWAALRSAPVVMRALRGINAAVVGLLAAALYTPVFTQGVGSPIAMAIAAACFVALVSWKVPPWAVVSAAGGVGAMVFAG